METNDLVVLKKQNNTGMCHPDAAVLAYAIFAECVHQSKSIRSTDVHVLIEICPKRFL